MKRISQISRILLVALAAATLGHAIAAAQSGKDPSPIVPSGLSGTEYYVAFPQNSDDPASALPKFLGLLISSEVPTVGTVEFTNQQGGPESRPFSTRPGQITKISLERWMELDITTSEELSKKGVRITSRAPVSVFVMNSRSKTGGGYAAVPVSKWGKEYYPLTLPNATGDRSSELVIVAAHDSTKVRYIPTTRTYRTGRGMVQDIVLNRGETWLIQADPLAADIGDLSATTITSSQPIGVIAAHVRTPIRPDGGMGDNQTYTSHVATMSLPSAGWSREFFSAPMRPTGDRFRILAIEDGTEITATEYFSGNILEQKKTIDAGEVWDVFSIGGQPINGAVHWTASKPVTIVQLRTGGQYSDPEVDGPAMLPLAGLDQLGTHTAFSTPDKTDQNGVFTDHTVTIIAKGDPSTALDDLNNPLRSIMIDGKPLYELAPGIQPQRIGRTGMPWVMYWVTVTVKSGSHTITSKESYPFTGFVSGNNGSVNGDAYLWQLPYWLERVADLNAPYLLTSSRAANTIDVTISDRDLGGGYFSGVEEIALDPSSGGWLRASFTTPAPDEDGVAIFEATQDPTQPLIVIVRDRHGNQRTVKINDGICLRTAAVDKTSIALTTSQGKEASNVVALRANVCGDTAHVQSITMTGAHGVYFTWTLAGDTTAPITILPWGGTLLTIKSLPTTPEGDYTVDLKIVVDDSTFTIPVSLQVGPTVSVPDEPVASFDFSVYPNPFASSTTLALDRPFGIDARVTISDGLGNIVRRFEGDQVAGRTRLTWDGTTSDGRSAPAGFYMISIADRDGRLVHGVTLVR